MDILSHAMYGLRDVFMYAGTKDVSLKEQITYTVLVQSHIAIFVQGMFETYASTGIGGCTIINNS